ncbi:Hint domain-containing protein [Roseovarius aestuariivivens]|uniref:Hint domain-containing protein n=1 Tax=Roseovarius aestuariivivens TaxID=1888910 RepID=UPI001AEC5550|nr:Hint domain-containing protein [Roseovarius aestuariivivens]
MPFSFLNVYTSDGSGNIADVGAAFPPGPYRVVEQGTVDGVLTTNELVIFEDGNNSFTIPQSTYLGTSGTSNEIIVTSNSSFLLFTDNTYTVGDPFPSIVNQDYTLCFAAGTLIATRDGERAVETLQIGDVVMTEDGRDVPVKWIGRQTVHKLFTPAERFEPVRVAADALGAGVPHSDLVLTADHALVLDGLAINAGALVNGTTITLDPRDSLPERVTYYHVETENHDVILANGAPAETYIDYIGRRAFDNHAEYLALYGDEPVIAEMPLPRVSSRRQLPDALRARFGISDLAEDITVETRAFLARRGAA